MEYHILTNINNKEPHQLQKPIENKNGEKKIGIKSITYYIGYFVFERDEYIKTGIGNIFTKISAGVYSIDEIIEIFKKQLITLDIEDGTFFATIKTGFASGTKIFITSGIMSKLGFSVIDYVDLEVTDRYWYNKKAEKPLKIPRELHVCLEELKTSNNYKNGKPSTTLEVLPANFIEEKINYLGYHDDQNIFETKKNYSSYNFKRFDYPSFKPLINGDINELKIFFKNEKNEDITNDIFYTIEFCIK